MALSVGSTEKKGPLDFKHVCSKCHKVFFFAKNFGFGTVVCPHCGHRL